MAQMMGDSLFPLLIRHEDLQNFQFGGVILFPLNVPWAMLEPHEAQARTNHGGQTLHRLAERGGLSIGEVLSVLDGKPPSFRRATRDEVNLLVGKIRDWQLTHADPYANRRTTVKS
jgi:hypothetical protein